MAILLFISFMMFFLAIGNALAYVYLVIGFFFLDDLLSTFIGPVFISASVGISSMLACLYFFLMKKVELGRQISLFIFALLFYFYGITKSTLVYTDILGIIISSGSFMSIFVIPYLYSVKDRLKKEKFDNLILFFIMLTAILTYLTFVGINILEFPLRATSFGLGVQLPNALFYTFSIIYLYGSNAFSRHRILILTFCLPVIFLQGHLSALLALFISLFLYIIHAQNIIRVIPKFIIVCISLSFFYTLLDNLQLVNIYLSQYFSEFASRGNQNLMRYSLLANEGMGYGFIPSDSLIFDKIEAYSLSRYDSTVGTIDDGYINIALIFGPIVGAIYLTVFLMFLLSIDSDKKLDNLLLCFLYSLFIVNLTFSAFSFLLGFFVIGLCFLVISPKKNIEDNS